VRNALPAVDGYTRFKPRGVMAVIGPFNFPGHLPNGHFIPALLAGNTIVFKPSEFTPAVGQFVTQLVDEAGFPPGVFNLLQGRAGTGEKLVANDEVDGILFTGSYDVGLKIRQDTINHHWKILVLEMGGKNASIVWSDAELEKAVYENIVGAYLSCGQRCSSTSRLILHKSLHDQFVEKFHLMAKKLRVGHWQDPVFMGPLINSTAVEKYLRFQEIAKRENCESLMRGKVLDLEKSGHYVTPSIHIVNKWSEESIFQSTEIFGPSLAIYSTEDFDEAIEINNSSGYGLVMSLFSKNEVLYRKAFLEAKVGLLNWNRATNGASSKLPFGGMGKSGNDRPSGSFAIDYCVIPVACLEDKTPLNKEAGLPGTDISAL